MQSLKVLLEQVIHHEASDLHLSFNLPPLLRMDGVLHPLDLPPMTDAEINSLIAEMLPPDGMTVFNSKKEMDFSYALKDQARFRVNIYTQQGHPAVAMRLIPAIIPTLEDLGMPAIVRSFCDLPQGLILVTGPTGQGKSTTLASMVSNINHTRTTHIISIADPIEYIFTPIKSLIAQREVYHDTLNWEVSLRSILREDPNVVLIGEMRDFETIRSAITIAETGHLVFATLHTNSASQAIDRIIDVFPEEQQRQIRVQLGSILEAVMSQRLLPRIQGGRVAALEIMVATTAVRNLIREGKTQQIDNVIATSAESGMVSLESSLATLVTSGIISEDVAMGATNQPDDLKRVLMGKSLNRI